MMRRGFFIGILLVAAMAMGGVAVWQTRAVGERDSIIAELRKFLTEADQMAGLARLEKHALEIDVQKARAALKDVGDRDALEALRAELAAARQQLSAAETAMIETEDRLAEEIAAHAAVRQHVEGLSERVAAAGREIEAAEAKADRAQAEIAKLNALLPAAQVAPESAMPAVTRAATPAVDGAAASETAASHPATGDPVGATGSLPDGKSESQAVEPARTIGPVGAAPPARKAAVKKPRPRRTAKPAIKAVKPDGSIFEPML